MSDPKQPNPPVDQHGIFHIDPETSEVTVGTSNGDPHKICHAIAAVFNRLLHLGAEAKADQKLPDGVTQEHLDAIKDAMTQTAGQTH